MEVSDVITGAGILFLSVLTGAALCGIPTGVALLVLEIRQWRADRQTTRQVSFHPRAKHIKGEPTVRIPIPSAEVSS
jgi:hypothetical protein